MAGRRQFALVIVLVMLTAGCVGKDADGLQGATTDDGTAAGGALGKVTVKAPQTLTLLAPDAPLPSWREVPLTVSITGPAADVRLSILDADRPASPCVRKDVRVPADVTLTCVFTASGERSLVARLTVLEDGAVAESEPVTIGVDVGRAPGLDVTAVRLLESGGFEVDVPVDVVLIGFDESVADALQAKVEPFTLAHNSYSRPNRFPPGASTDPSTVAAFDAPVRTVAHPRVTAIAPADAAHVLAFAASATAGDGALDANAVEAHLAEFLPRFGVPLDPNRPALVLLHGNGVLPDGHSWTYALPTGTLENVRAFGEREPVLVLDVSAAEDPWVQERHGALDGSSTAPAYASPLAAGGDGVADALAAAVKDALVLRLLQGPLYPPSTASCHAITAVVATRTTSLHGPGLAATHAADAEALTQAFERVLGEGRVFVDVKTLTLPQDDPALDVLVRTATVADDQVRWWMEENWDAYWEPHDGCEAYVSLLVQGDAVNGGTGYAGWASHDSQQGARISFSFVSDLYDVLSSPEGGQHLNYLLAHETGHLVGLRHPHDEQAKDQDARSWAFSSVWSAMSYQTSAAITDFSAVDAANLARNRAAYAVQEAMADGLTEDDPALGLALEHLSRFQWRDAALALESADGGPA